jgi:D-arabinose 1-dehydrogenase-like Zn-dependent alcohol dehydrogenase
LEEEIASINENVISKVDEYLEYVVSEWVEENKLAIDSGIRSEIAEDFMQGLKNLFQEHYIDIPEEKVDMVEELASKVEALESELDKMVTENTSLNAEVGSYKKDVIVAEISEGLTEVQAAKLSQLAENIEFVSEEDYKEKVSLTKRKYFSEAKEEDQETVKDQFGADEELETASMSPVMEHYVKNISKILRK